uniref:large conductance mechanosensitive channel protein MscL n=1 Tax=Streptomyces lushanensis TaxID=1434255 RepID=UPI000A9DB4F7
EDAAFAAVLPKVEEAIARSAQDGVAEPHQLQQLVRRSVGKWVSDTYRRRPMILREVVTGIPIMWGTVLSAVLTFVITAAVVYFLMVLPMARYLARRARQQAAKEEVKEVMEVSELEVLKEIRDALVAQRDGSGQSPR